MMNQEEYLLNKILNDVIGRPVEVTEELEELMKVYTDAEEQLKQREANALHSHTLYMKQYLEVSEKRKEVSNKILNLKNKMGSKEEDEGDDE